MFDLKRFFKVSVASLCLTAGLVSACFAGAPTSAEVEAKFGKLLRNTKVASVKGSDVPGLYEVTAGPNVFYYSPAGGGHLVFGQIIDKDGKNLTAEVQGRLRAEYQKHQEVRAAAILKTLPLDKAVKIGNGPNVVIEFTDPDCPYCRKVDEFLAGRTDVTRYVFLNPLDSLHPNARARSAHILASKDREKAFRDAFTGKSTITSADLAKYPVEAKQLEENIKYGQQLGLQGTPLLFVNGGMVNGADTNRIVQLLKK